MNLPNEWLVKQLETLQPSSKEWERLFTMYEPPADPDFTKSFEQFRRLVPIDKPFTLLELRRGKFGPPFNGVPVEVIYLMLKFGILKIIGETPYGKARLCNVYTRII